MNFRIIKLRATGPDRPVLLFRGAYTQDGGVEVIAECYSNSDGSYEEEFTMANEQAAQCFIRDFSTQSATEFVSRMKSRMAMTNTTTEQQTIAVPMDKYTEIGGKLSSQRIAEQGSCKTFWWLNRRYVSVGAVGRGNGRDWDTVMAHRVVAKVVYTGRLYLLAYDSHNAEVSAGRRPIGYEGMLVVEGGTPLVLVGPEIQFVGVVATHQTSLFEQ